MGPGLLSALTGHARARMRQRGIRAEALEALLEHGRVRHLNSRGRSIVYLDKAARAWVGDRAGAAGAVADLTWGALRVTDQGSGNSRI